MKATNTVNCKISEIIGKELSVRFENKEWQLGSWGDVDNYCVLGRDKYLLLECERGQKHPNTNVLKLYPYLEDNKEVTLTLLHYFFPENKAPKNRVALCHFISKKIEEAFPGRFLYLRLPSDEKAIPAFFQQQKEGLTQKLFTMR